MYLEFSDEDYTKLRKSLIAQKGGSFQKEILDVARDSQRFVSWLESHVKTETEGEVFDLLADRLSEFEYKEPPKAVEKNLFAKWEDLTPAQASQETFWGYVTLEHIKAGVIESHFLAANGGNLPGGLERIEKALAEGSENNLDSITRTILRRLGGLPEARGAKSVYVNCPFSRAWWRCRVADEVAAVTGADFEQILKTLTVSQDYWEKLIVLIVSRNSVLGDTNVRTALIWALSDFIDDKERSDLFLGKTLKNISRHIGIRSAWQELGVFTVADLKPIMEKEFLGQ